MQVKKVKVGVIGCGTICRRTYMPNLMTKFNIIEVVGVADLIPERSAAMAEQWGVKQMSNEEIYNDPEIEVVCNLTYPESHFEVTRDALLHGKHVYCEKMMACDFEEATKLVNLAEEKGLMFTTAPDTFLGAWIQSARKYIDDGFIGTPIAIHAQHNCSYQPNTEQFDLSPDTFFFPLHRGGGLPFDWGGYYLHAMINFLGTINRVAGFGGTINPDRPYTHPAHPKYKENFHVDTPTSLFGALEFANGCHGTFQVTSDATISDIFEINGTDGTIILGNPNYFGGEMYLRRAGIEEPLDVANYVPPEPGSKPAQLGERAKIGTMKLPLLHGYYDSSRGVGLADMAYALRNNRRPRAHYDIGYHAIEVIHGIITSGQTGQVYNMTTRCERPKPIRPSALAGRGQEITLDD